MEANNPCRASRNWNRSGLLGRRCEPETQIEAALRESETRFRTLVEQSPFSTQIFRPDGTVITVNQAFCNLWEASQREARYIIENYKFSKMSSSNFPG